jgi:hypothetical protein
VFGPEARATRQFAADAGDCTTFTWNMTRELALFGGAATPLSAAVNAGAAPALALDTVTFLISAATLLRLPSDRVRAIRLGVPPPVAEAEPDTERTDDEVLTEAALRHDPIGRLGEAIGEDGERWWDRFIEHRQDPGEVFGAIAELMAELREGVPSTDVDLLREAAMRQAVRDGEQTADRIAFVCGAYHVPALLDREGAATSVEADAAALAGLTTAAIETTWVPWSESHLSMWSGYGAGIESPGWYGHLWSGGRPLVEHWLVRVARLLRDEGFDISPAHLIEASRLAETTAAIRGRSTPGLGEVNEAIRAVLTAGSDVPLALIAERLIIGTALGSVPASVETAPLARDLAAEQRRLRMKPEAVERILELDLRGDTDRGRSHLLHRLRVLDVPWGIPTTDTRRAMGTFREPWRLRWDPMFAVALVTQSRWGNTISEAATARLLDEAEDVDRLDELSARLELSLYADLPEATAGLTARVGVLAAVSSDVAALLSALPPLARSLRYGSVREHDSEALGGVVRAILQRAAVGLPSAVTGLDDDGAAEMVRHVEEGAEAVGAPTAGRLIRTQYLVTCTQGRRNGGLFNPAMSSDALKIPVSSWAAKGTFSMPRR